MSNIRYHYHTPEENKRTGIIMMIMHGMGVALCFACLITEGFGFWPVYIPLFGCSLGIKTGYDVYKEGRDKINSRKQKND